MNIVDEEQRCHSLSGASVVGVYFLMAALALAFTFACNDSNANTRDEQTNNFHSLSKEDASKIKNTGKSNVSSDSNLEVRIKIKGDNKTDNAKKPEDFKTKFEVVVKRNGQSVSDADVTVHAYNGPTTKLKFDRDDDSDDEDEYEGQIDGYFRTYQVDIVAGNDRVEGIQFAGPTIHFFTAPEQNQTVPKNADLKVTWKNDGTPANEASIEGEGFKKAKIDDNGSYTIPASNLGDDGDDDDDEIELQRINRMKLPELAGDSEIIISIENEVEFKLK